MTKIYFIRHAEPNYDNHDDMMRELSHKGQLDSQKIIPYLLDKSVKAIYSSPYRRAYDTIKPFADTVSLPIILIEDFRERKISDDWIEDFQSFSKKQ